MCVFEVVSESIATLKCATCSIPLQAKFWFIFVVSVCVREGLHHFKATEVLRIDLPTDSGNFVIHGRVVMANMDPGPNGQQNASAYLFTQNGKSLLDRVDIRIDHFGGGGANQTSMYLQSLFSMPASNTSRDIEIYTGHRYAIRHPGGPGGGGTDRPQRVDRAARLVLPHHAPAVCWTALSSTVMKRS